MTGLIYNCLPSDVIFNFSPPMSVEQASILDHLGFLFSFSWGISGKQTQDCLFLLISQATPQEAVANCVKHCVFAHAQY